MSYYVTITRRPSPLWKSGENISLEEWRAVALASADVREPTAAELARDAPWAKPTDLIWTGHHEHPEVWFGWYSGQIDVKNPDEIILAMMAKLAKQLGARLIGEGGELFDEAGNSRGVFDLPEDPSEQKPSLWRRIFGSRG